MQQGADIPMHRFIVSVKKRERKYIEQQESKTVNAMSVMVR
jgi:hypothetical protein